MAGPVLLLVVILSIVDGCRSSGYYTIFEENGTWEIFSGKKTTGIAWGVLYQELSQTGFDRLYITTNNAFPDDVQMFAAGYLEGFLTTSRIWSHWSNYYALYFNSTDPAPGLTQWLTEQDAWQRAEAANPPPDDKAYWTHAALVTAQFDGLVAGYNDFADPGKRLTAFQLLLLNSYGDVVEDLIPAFTPGPKDWSSKSQAEIRRDLSYRSHCSVLIKVRSDFEDVFAAHTTWTDYSMMTRMYKSYTLPLSAPGTTCKQVVFASYPGYLSSVDDFYLCDSGLFVTETTNTVVDTHLYKRLKPEGSVLSWHRAMIANRVAQHGADWVATFSKYNSGTYNNQWIVLDYNKFKPGLKLLTPGLVTIVEQIPGQLLSADVTDKVQRTGFWSSYNRPYFPAFFDLLGYKALTEKYGDEFSYSRNPRALIFNRDAPSVASLADMQRIMLYNKWQTDPLSMDNAGNAIASRFDLVSVNYTPPIDWLTRGAHGGTDSKIAPSYTSAKTLEFVGQSGPTHDDQVPFAWSQGWQSVPHVGLPDTFDFDWVTFSPNG